ncbi:hypothetical protein QBC46DRAFT_294653 [Diplogelasinospora grovesii]|uniref:Aminoglycoside phosphotransferase domain-containing protein n=1 Tax=Diplogelasinospora grovesii TaxID=303347 RepID=A0AAN6N132_9PEZI|nr:hypothetical protein QBC46DRAFT_294653 [Diplogelasinospora grovesii]
MAPSIANPAPSAPKPKPLPKWLQLRIAATEFGRARNSRRLGTGNVVQLPFKKIAKLDVPRNEIEAMEFVRSNTTVPVARSTCVSISPDTKVMVSFSPLEGDDLQNLLSQMTYEQVASVVHELAGYLNQLRSLSLPSLPPSKNKEGSKVTHIGGAKVDSRGFDHRFPEAEFGPFSSVADFHTFLRLGEPLGDLWSHAPAVLNTHGKPEGSYKVVFTHGDIAPRNIRVAKQKDGTYKITGIIDWECAGWYPEYWEYTRMFYTGERDPWKKWFDAIEAEEGIQKYKEERVAEEAIWERARMFE